MEAQNRYFIVGLFVLLGLLAIAGFGLWLVHPNAKEEATRPYIVYFDESVNGLTLGSPVKFKGVQVGLVKEIALERDPVTRVAVKLDIQKNTPIKQDTVAELHLQGITGNSYIELEGGSAQLADLSPPPNGGPTEIKAKTSDLANIVNQVPELVGKTSHVVDQAGKMLSDDNVALTHSILTHLDDVAGTLDSESAKLDEVLDMTKHALAAFDRLATEAENGHLQETMANLRAASANFRDLSASANSSTRASFEELQSVLLEVRSTSREIGTLSRKLGDNPSQIIYPTQEGGVKLP